MTNTLVRFSHAACNRATACRCVSPLAEVLNVWACCWKMALALGDARTVGSVLAPIPGQANPLSDGMQGRHGW